MITFIAFLLTILGCVNWLLIGLLQYDFIAGLFGFQASMFSRIIYIIFGVAAAYLVLRVIINKGTFKVWEKKKGTRASLNQEQENQPQQQPAYANIEAGQEQVPQNNIQPQQNTPQSNAQSQQKPKKKKWWQFWKRDPSKKKKKNGNPSVSDKSLTPPLTSGGEMESVQENNMPPVDIDISLNNTPEHFNEQPSTTPQPNQDNLFDEHFGKLN